MLISQNKGVRGYWVWKNSRKGKYYKTKRTIKEHEFRRQIIMITFKF